jgi:hypothetical protein
MTATFQNSAMVLSIGFFFSLMIAGLAGHLPSAMAQGLTAHGVPAADASRISALPPVGVLFAAFLGYNPIQELLGGVLGQLPPDQAAFLTGRSFFPQLISAPFSDGLSAAFWFAIVVCLVAAVASWLVGKPKPVVAGEPHESPGSELAAAAGELVDVAGGDEPGRITGRLRATDGRRLAGVVTVTGLDGRQVARAVADADEGYAVAELRPGTYTLIITSPGFHPEAASVTVNGFSVVHDFALAGGTPVTVTLHGTVTGPGGEGLPGATVTVNDQAGEVAGQVVSGPDGGYELSGLDPGEYTVVTKLFEPAVRQVELGQGESATVDLDFSPDGASESRKGSGSR